MIMRQTWVKTMRCEKFDKLRYPTFEHPARRRDSLRISDYVSIQLRMVIYFWNGILGSHQE